MRGIKDALTRRRGDIREAAAYAVAGVLTTAVNYGCYALLRQVTGIRPTLCTAVAWAVSVAFAYAVNRRFVFKTQNVRGAAMAREAGLFVLARVLSLALDMGIVWLFAEKMGMNDYWVKLGANVFVIVANYFASKLMIFKKE